LTIANLHTIRTAFVDILQGVHHPRIKYPDQAKTDKDETEEDGSEKEYQTAAPQSKPSSEPPSPAPAIAPPPLLSAEAQSGHPVRRE
jgi:hypothetical protein